MPYVNFKEENYKLDKQIKNRKENNKKLKDWYENIEVYESDENQNPILELDNICFSYNNEKQILKNVSFKINKGDMAAIVGRNGAGK